MVDSIPPQRRSMVAPPPPTAATLPPNVLDDFLRQSALFRSCDAAVIAGASPHVETLVFNAGGFIIRSGIAADGIWMIYRGKATVSSHNMATGVTTPIESIVPGDFFGEIGALLGTAQANVVADEPTLAIRVPMHYVEMFSTRVPQFSLNLARRLAMRLVQMSVASLRGAARPSEPPVVAGTPSIAPMTMLPSNVIPFVECADYDISPRLLSMIPLRLVQQHKVVPLMAKPGAIVIGMVQPRNLSALAEIKRALYGVEVEVVAISFDDYSNTSLRLRTAAGILPAQGRVDARNSVSPDAIVFDHTDTEREGEKAVRVIGEEVVRWASRIIAAGLEREAADVHIESEASGIRVRFRVQGLLEDWNELVPSSLAKGIVARFKVLAGLDITERRLPQDGRIGLSVGAGKREVDLRITTVPASRGEKIVLRVAEAATAVRSLELTFMEPTTLANVRRALNLPSGAIIIAGGSGAGKTATLYSLLAERRKTRPDTNITMIEDPIEYRLQGVTQVQVNHTVGLGFPQVLRSVLRLDPDVIAVGDVRDRETAQIALEAATAGHVVPAPLHANNVFSAIHRLEALGCERALIAQGVSLVMAQKLIPRLCGSCARLEQPTPMMQDALVASRLIDKGSSVQLPRPVGCDACNKTGFLGRIAVVESLIAGEEFKNALALGQPLQEVLKSAAGAKQFLPMRWYASYLMSRRLISAADAILAVAE